MKFTLYFLLITFFLNGCASTSDVTAPINTEIAHIKGDIRTLEDKVARNSSNLDNLQDQLANDSSENADVLAVIKENQNTLKDALTKLSYNQKKNLDKTSKALMNTSLKEFDQYNKKLENIIKIVKGENASIQKKVASDMQTLQNQFKSVRVQLNASIDKIDRLENQLKIVTSTFKKYKNTPPVKSYSTKKAPKKNPKKAKKQPLKRTGNPSSSDIDYINVYEHTIVSGESFWKLSRDYNVPIQDIINVNENITDETRLNIGDKLYIPSRKSGK